VTAPSSPAGVILAGGASSRMGADKAFVEVGGRAMIVRVADALRAAGCEPVSCQGGDARLTASFGLEVVPDATVGGGPVAAILAALRSHGGPVVIAACDLVDLDPATIRAVIAAAASNQGALVTVATADDRPHLLSYWRPTALAPLAELVAEGVTAYRIALGRLAAAEVAVDRAAVRNVNRPEDLG